MSQKKKVNQLNIIGVVLAGGQSSRMLKDKSQLIWRQSTLLQHAKSLLVSSGCKEVIVSRNNDSQCIADRFSQSGPMAGIDACLQHTIKSDANADAMLVMPVDMPLMTVELLSNLISEFEVSSLSKRAVFYSLGRFPLLLSVDNEIAKLITTNLEQQQSSKGLSIRQLLKQLTCKTIDIDRDQQRAFYNCNTPEEWRKIASD